MCDLCKNDMPFLNYEITVHNGKEPIHICPNCAAGVSTSIWRLGDLNGDFTSEISGKSGAVKVKDTNASDYFVTADELQRLFGHYLLPNEYKALLKNHDAGEYLIHDDFYNDDGIAYQPINDGLYLDLLSKYCDDLQDLAEKNEIEEYIRFMKG